MAFTCQDGQPCTGQIDGVQHPADPVTTFACPTGTYITKISIAPNPSNNDVGAVSGVTCSDTSTVPGCAGALDQPGGCASGPAYQVVDCAQKTPPGIIGFGGRSNDDTDYAYLTPICADGHQALTGFDTGGAVFNDIQCPQATHRLTSVTFSSSTGGTNVVTSGTITCTPLSSYCSGNTLISDPACFSYCNAHLGQCDTALKALCAQTANYEQPVCSCALPDSQYPFLGLKSPSGVAPSVACSSKCQSTGAIKLVGTGSCFVQTLCIQSGNDVTAIQSSLGTGVSLAQNCGGGTSSNAATTSPLAFLTSTAGLLIIGLVLLIIIVIIIIIVVSRNKAKRKAEDLRRQQLETQRTIERQQIRQAAPALPRRPTVVRVE
jgi:hypothetical protein